MQTKLIDGWQICHVVNYCQFAVVFRIVDWPHTLWGTERSSDICTDSDWNIISRNRIELSAWIVSVKSSERKSRLRLNLERE